MNNLLRRITNNFTSQLLRTHILRSNNNNLIQKTLISTGSVIPSFYPTKTSFNSVRYKSKKRQEDSDDEEDYDTGDSSLHKDSKVVKFKTTSLRTDLIIKSALGVARNKIEQLFYESKIRVNGRKILKKSVTARPGDEIDVIKSISPKNPDHLIVARVEIMKVAAKDDAIEITTRRFKNLLIENYEQDPYKGSADSES